LPNISKDSLDIFEKCGNYKVDAIKLNYSDKIIDVCKYIKQNYSNMEIVLSINDFECIYLSNFEKLVDRVRIVDTLGIITHYEIEEVFDLIQDSTTFDLPIEYQFRNDTSSAVYNSYTALSNGCSHIAISVLGIGKRNGITDLSGFISRIYANDKQLLKRYDLPVLKHLDEFVAKRLGIHIPINNPITGICSWEQNIVYDEDFNTNIIFTQDINLFKKIMQHIMPNVYEKLTDDYIRKLYIQINDDTSKDTTLYIKLNSDIYYARDYIGDIREVFLDPIFRYNTFLEPVNDVEVLLLRAWGFASFFREPYHDNKPKTREFMLMGFLMFWNSGEYDECQPNCPIYFQHIHEYQNDLEPDSGVGTEFRTMVNISKTKRFTQNNVNIYCVSINGHSQNGQYIQRTRQGHCKWFW
jgi:hypothetical protein